MAEKTSTEHYAVGSQIAIEAMKSLLLVNGGAATALIALTDKTGGGTKYAISVLLFGCAALLNAITLVVGYFSQLSYANHVLAIEHENAGDAEVQIKRHSLLQRIAIGIVLASMVFSMGGMTKAFCST